MTRDRLHQNLTDIATEVRIVDLYDRSLATSRHIRNRQVASTSAIVAVFLVLAGTAFAFLPLSGTPDIADPSPSVTGSPTATASPPVGPALTLGELRNATIDVPEFAAGCGGRQTFTNGQHESLSLDGSHIDVDVVQSVAIGDAFGEGRDVTVALITCGMRPVPMWTAIALDRGPGDTVVTRAVIASLDSPAFALSGVRIPAPGRVEVQFTYPTGLEGSGEPQHQWRTFKWNGQAFAQIAGPTAFDAPYETKLGLSVTPLAFTAQPNGSFQAQTRVTLTNNGVNRIGSIALNVSVDPSVTVAFTGASATPHPSNPALMQYSVTLTGLAPGESTGVITMTFSAPTNTPPTMCSFDALAKAADGHAMNPTAGMLCPF